MSEVKKPKRQRTNMTAIIYDKKGHILSIGKNSYIKTHTLMYKLSKEINPKECPTRVFVHAEIDAIIRCNHIKKAHKILVLRLNAKGEYALAKPCPICEKAILEQTPIKIVEFSVDNNTTDFL